jgi:hypothetical protein
MKLRIEKGLPLVAVDLVYQGRKLRLGNVLVDTGSAGKVFSADRMGEVGLTYDATDRVHRIRGVGGVEFVFTKQLDALAIGSLVARDFEVEIGALDYGLPIDGIVGTDFLVRTGALINLAKLEIGSSP